MFGNKAILHHLDNDLKVANTYLTNKKERFLKIFNIYKAHLKDLGDPDAIGNIIGEITAMNDLYSKMNAELKDVLKFNIGEFSAKCAQLASYVDQER